jgi:hypothetical protein
MDTNEQSYQEKYPPITEEQARQSMRELDEVLQGDCAGLRAVIAAMWEERLRQANAYRDMVLMREADSQLGEKLEEKQQFFDFGASHRVPT